MLLAINGDDISFIAIKKKYTTLEQYLSHKKFIVITTTLMKKIQEIKNDRIYT